MRVVQSIALVAVFILVFCGVVYAGEGNEVPWYLGEGALGLVVAVIGIIWGLAKAWFLAKNKKWARIIQLAEAAINKIYVEEVRELKKLSEDGRLSKEDVERLSSKAWALIKESAKEQGIDILKYVAETWAPAWIAKLIAGMRSGANTVTNPN